MPAPGRSRRPAGVGAHACLVEGRLPGRGTAQDGRSRFPARVMAPSVKGRPRGFQRPLRGMPWGAYLPAEARNTYRGLHRDGNTLHACGVEAGQAAPEPAAHSRLGRPARAIARHGARAGSRLRQAAHVRRMRHSAGHARKHGMPLSRRRAMGCRAPTLHRDTAEGAEAQAGAGAGASVVRRKAPEAVSGSKAPEPEPEAVERLATATLQSICRDEKAPAGARAQAARTLLEMAGMLAGKSRFHGSVAAELSSSEIDEMLANSHASEG